MSDWSTEDTSPVPRQHYRISKGEPPMTAAMQVKEALLPCPFCGGAMEEVTDEDGHYFVHPGRRGMERTDCWLADAWVSDEPSGEGSIGEWNTRAPSLAVDPGTVEALAIAALREWFKFQSNENANHLYNAAGRLFGSDFNPAEYDDVE